MNVVAGGIVVIADLRWPTATLNRFQNFNGFVGCMSLTCTAQTSKFGETNRDGRSGVLRDRPIRRAKGLPATCLRWMLQSRA